MTREQIFESWAPTGSIWSSWVKPALFSHLPRSPVATAESLTIDISWMSIMQVPCAIVVDLPGAASVEYGLALASLGYRPIPLFNAIPLPVIEDESPVVAAVDLEPILAALQVGAERLRSLSIPANAPPAFLLDANRQTARQAVTPGTFDNRSVAFITDFPSTARLSEHGIKHAILVRESQSALGDDLRFVLQTWQKAGLQLSRKWLAEAGGPAPFSLPRPSWFAGLWWRLKAVFGLRRNAAGEFGTFLRMASSG